MWGGIQHISVIRYRVLKFSMTSLKSIRIYFYSSTFLETRQKHNEW